MELHLHYAPFSFSGLPDFLSGHIPTLMGVKKKPPALPGCTMGSSRGMFIWSPFQECYKPPKWTHPPSGMADSTGGSVYQLSPVT